MKTKTRHLIGNILVWGGLAVITSTTGITLWLYHINSTLTHALTFSYMNVVGIVSLLIGGLWGMRK